MVAASNAVPNTNQFGDTTRIPRFEEHTQITPEVLRMLGVLRYLARFQNDGRLGQMSEDGASEDLVYVSEGRLFSILSAVLQVDTSTIKCHYGMHVHLEVYRRK